jgi:hypothetical protein
MIDGSIESISKIAQSAYREYFEFFQFLPKMTSADGRAKLFVHLIMSKMQYNKENGSPMYSSPGDVILSGIGNEIELSVLAKVLFEKIDLIGKILVGTYMDGSKSVFVSFDGTHNRKFIYTAYSVINGEFVKLDTIEI